MPKVSVIIPYYNQGAFLLDALGSLKKQRFKDFEVIIINDGSTDAESIRIFNSLSDSGLPCILISQENAGPSVARNKAVNMAKGEYLVFLDADDLICENTIALCYEAMENDDETGIVYGNNGLFGGKIDVHRQGNFNIIKMLRANEIALCSMVRKKAFIDAGRFDESLSKKGLEDWDFWLSLYEKNWKFKYIDELMFDVRVNDSSRTFTVSNKQIDDLRKYIYNKHSAILSEAFLELYHENKNIKKTIDVKIGKALLSPARYMKKLFTRK